MNKILTISLFSFFTLCLSLGLAQGTKDMNTMIPLDNTIKTGTLKNGMKYFIKQNKRPEKRMELRLAVNVGAVEEDDDQKGLAHFVEHMCFNGTTNFPKNDLINFLEKTGVKFGAHLNAYTSFEETVYMLQLPTDNNKIMKKGMQVMVDWASNVTFADEEIDKERGVIREELRLRANGNSRVMEKHAPIIWNNAKLAYRFPGGDTSVIMNAPYETFRRFYKDWYRPDLMAIIAVGDFKESDIEEYITEMFNEIPARTKVRAKDDNSIKPWNGMKVSIQTDKELTFPYVAISYGHKEPKRGTYNEYKGNIIDGLAAGMLNLRFNELTQKANPPFTQAQSSISAQLGNSKTLDLFVVLKGDDFSYGYASMLTELFRAKNGGFTATELERVKKEVLNSYETMKNEKDKVSSAGLAMEYVRHFLKEEAVPGIETEFELVKNWLNEITVEDVNKVLNALVIKDNIGIAVSLPETAGIDIPSEDMVKEIYADISGQQFDAYVDNTINKPFFDKDVKEGKVTKTTENKKLGTTTWELSNGAIVTIKKNDFKDQEILFRAYSLGGNSLCSDADHINAMTCDEVVENSGLSEFNPIDLQKVLVGKNANVSPFVSEITEGMSGNSTPKDLETMMQMINLYFTAPRKDTEAFKSFTSKQMDMIKKSKLEPNTVFYDSIGYVMGNYNPRRKPITEDTYKSIDLNKAYSIYKQRFADASDFKFYFVGNIDESILKPYVEKYIGSLPSTNSKEKYVDLNIESMKAPFRKTVVKGKEPKSAVYLNIGGDFEYNSNNRYLLNSLISVLNIRLREELREEKGGVYGVGVYPQMTKMPKSKYSVIVQFGCQPDRVEELVSTVKDVMKELQTKLTTDDNLLKTTETQKRSFESDIKENGFWLNNLVNYDMNGENPEDMYDYNNKISKLKKEDIQKAAKLFLDVKKMKEFVLMPEKN